MSSPVEFERVLILIDDEPNILSALKRHFRRETYRILTAESGDAALRLLANNPIAVVISDQRMPGMTGTELLFRVKHDYPETVRIILSGYTELNPVRTGIQNGSVSTFLTKPWDDALLSQLVRVAFEQLESKCQTRQSVL